MRTHLKIISVLVSASLLASCVSVPNGPSNMALPGTGKDFNQFRADDASCRQFALDQTGGATANQASANSFVESAVVGTVIGALIGAAAGRGRATGAGAATGLFVGSMVGAGSANASSYGTQHRYDNAYTQCMYSSGHRVPVSGHIEQQPTYNAPPPPPSNYPPPPPPPGYNSPPPRYYSPTPPDLTK
jgi:hypothetical protein